MLTQATSQTGAVELSRPALVKLLERARHVVPSRSPKPILTCVRLAISQDLLQLRATDLEMSLFAQMPAQGILPACVVPFEELRRRLKVSKQLICELSLSEDGSQLLINGGCVKHALQTLDPADFPMVPFELEGDSIEVDAAEFVGALKVAGHAVATEPSRYAIDGILLESDDQKSRLVATDGRRLVIAKLLNAGNLDGRAILPRSFCKLIEKLTTTDTDVLALGVSSEAAGNGDALPSRLFAAGPDWLLSTIECEGQFPSYRDVVPKSHSKFAINRTSLSAALKEVAIATSIESNLVRLRLSPDELELKASAPGVGESTATLPCEFLGGGDSIIHTAFNPEFLRDALKTLDNERIIIDVDQNGCGGDSTPCPKPALFYAQHDRTVHWVIMPINPGLEASPETLGSNYPQEQEKDNEH